MKTISYALASVLILALLYLVVQQISAPKGTFSGVYNVPSYSTASSTLYSVGNQLSTKVLDQRGGRGYAILCNVNPPGNKAYIDFGTTAITATTSADVLLAVNTCYEINNQNLFTGQVNVISETATTTSILVTEFLSQ